MGRNDATEYSEREAAQRRDAALRVALTTPPKPHSESKGAKPKGKRRKSPAKARDSRK